MKCSFCGSNKPKKCMGICLDCGESFQKVYMPTKEDIEKATERIRSGWSAETHSKRTANDHAKKKEMEIEFVKTRAERVNRKDIGSYD